MGNIEPCDTVHGLTAEESESFEREGYVVVDDVIDVDTYLDPLMEEHSQVLDRLLVKCHSEGVVRSTHPDLGFDARFTKLYEETGQEWVQHFDLSLPLNRATSPDEPCHFGPSVFAMLVNPSVLDLVESIIGPEILSDPVQHVRFKPPARTVSEEQVIEQAGLVGETPWHQDASVVSPDADDTEMITVWIPLKDVTEENGCLRVAPRNHHGGLIEQAPHASTLVCSELHDHAARRRQLHRL